MKKILALAVSIAFLSSFLSMPAFGAVKAGGKCLKEGSTSIVSGKKFTCVKTGKKLIWKSQSPDSKQEPISKSGSTSSQSTTSSNSQPPSKEDYYIQWTLCGEALIGHNGWVLGRTANQSEYTFLRCTKSQNQDGSPTIIWQIPEDAAKIDQTSKLPIIGSGFIPKVISNTLIQPDWYGYTAANHPQAPKSFGDLYQNRAGISFSVWSAIRDSANSYKGEVPPIDVMARNPKATYSELGLQNLQYLHKAMNSPQGIKRTRIYYFDRDTVAQVAKQVEQDMGSTEYKLGQQNQGGPLVQCYGTSDCNNSNAWATNDGTLYLFMGVPNNQDERLKRGASEPTEYFHAVWSYIYAKSNSWKAGASPAIFPDNQPPFWLNIGLEEISGNFSGSKDDFKNYMKANVINSAWISEVIPDFSEKWLNNYLDISNLGNRWSDARLGVANNSALIVGPKITEILISLHGTSAFFDFYQRMSQGESFESVFKDIYKLSWQEAKPTFVKVIFDQLSN